MKIGVNERLLAEGQQTGIQNYIANLYQQIQLMDERNQYLFFGNKFKGKAFDKVFFDLYGIRKELVGKKIDIYHSPSLTLPIGSKLCRYVVTVHDLGFKVLPQLGKRSDRIYFDFVLNNIKKQADMVVTDSEIIKEEVMHYYNINETRVKIVPLGIDEFFQKRESAIYLSRIAKKYDLNQKRVIFMNGAHSPRKNVPSAIEAIKRLSESCRDLLLVISGDIHSRYLNEKLKNGGEIHSLPYVTKRELRALYQASDLFLYPSLYEGFGLPILEALASRTKVLASNIGAVKEIINKPEWLFDPMDIKGMVDKIQYALENGAGDKDFNKVRDRVLEKFTWKKSAKAMIDLYSNLAK